MSGKRLPARSARFALAAFFSPPTPKESVIMVRFIQRCCAFAGLLLASLLPAVVVARADEPTAETKAAAEQYAGLRSEWDATNKQIDQVVQDFAAASAEQRIALRTQYASLVEKANGLLPKLRVAGIAAYKIAPNEDRELTRLLVGIVANDVRSDRYDAAMELASLLIENGCEEKAIYGQAGAATYCRDQFDLAEQYLKTAQDAGVLPEDGEFFLSDLAEAKKRWEQEQATREAEAKADDLPRVLLKTSKGDLTIELYENEAPQAVANFISLVEQGFYNGLTFHRVLPGFMAQGGCPEGTGTGGPGYKIYCECQKENHRNHFRGSLSMAHAGPNTGGSQFFLTFRRTAHLDGRHTVFGRVIEGLPVLEKLQRIDPSARGTNTTPDKIVEAKVLRKRDHEYQPTKVK
jgi:cyclophilin family peptidyl-prolyl cis-trans isomerase